MTRQKRREVDPLGALLPGILKQAGARQQALQQVQAAWAAAVGRAMAAHTKPVSIRRGVVYVQTDEPGASFTLTFEKTRLVRALQQAAPDAKIEDVVLRAGHVPGAASTDE
ncbi:MAG: DUF721 domain-containing protein [Candidatus Omnitrophica bacterium]|nr:DUF721 domain-containing protein [Candidatus Omnitrophota bacterium]